LLTYTKYNNEYALCKQPARRLLGVVSAIDGLSVGIGLG